MNCMKCGRDLKDQKVFCSRCLTEMAKYPVKPNTVVQLPIHRAEPAVKKPPRKPEPKPEEQVRHLRSTVRWLRILLVVTLLAFAFAANVLLYYLNQQDAGQEIGKNYTTHQEK